MLPPLADLVQMQLTGKDLHIVEGKSEYKAEYILSVGK
jgi:hypothetical protein